MWITAYTPNQWTRLTRLPHALGLFPFVDEHASVEKSRKTSPKNQPFFPHPYFGNNENIPPDMGVCF